MRQKSIAVLVCLLTSVLAEGQEKPQIDWVGDWDKAFAQAKAEGKPVMLCINSKDKESANKKTAQQIYRDTGFVLLSRKFVMIVISVRTHKTSGVCPRFGKVTCQEHLDCWKSLRANHAEQFMASVMSGTMISPQHAWFRPDGTLLRRKEYFLSKAELTVRMRKVLAEIRAAKKSPESGAKGTDGDVSGGEGGTGKGDKDPIDVRAQPLTDKEKAEVHRVTTSDKEGRRAALSNLLATEKTAAHTALRELLATSKSTPIRCDILRAFGRAQIVDARETIAALLNDKEALVRSFAAVALEDLRLQESIPALLKRAKRERDTYARKNMYRAAGACGGPAADKDAAKALLRALRTDKQNAIKKHAAYALHHYTGPEASKLVLRKLETAGKRSSDYGIRGAIVYTLAAIGNLKTTLPVLQKIRDDNEKNRWVRPYLNAAIRKLKGESAEFGRSAYFLLSEDRDDPARDE